jgi:hypothetical protein
VFSRRVTELRATYGKNTRVSIDSMVREGHTRRCQSVNQEVVYFEIAEASFMLGHHLAEIMLNSRSYRQYSMCYRPQSFPCKAADFSTHSLIQPPITGALREEKGVTMLVQRQHKN